MSPRNFVITVALALNATDRRLFLKPHLQRLTALVGGIHFLDAKDAPTSAELQSVNPTVVITGWSSPALEGEWLLREQGSVRYVCHLAGSVRRIVPREFISRGGLVTNWGSLASAAVAEHALLLGLAGLRNVARWRETIERGSQSTAQVLGTRTLFGRRVGIHGFGGVARALVSLLRPFGVEIAAYSAGVPDELFRVTGVARCESLRALSAQSEVLFECEALTPATQGCVGAAELAALPDGAVFVNVGRGRLVDEAALLREAESGRIRVALDVVSHEPLSGKDPLYCASGSLLSPHIGGPTADQYPAIGAFAVENVAAFAAGKPLQATVSVDAYDRAT